MPYALFTMLILVLSGLLDSKIERWQGGFFLIVYAIYMAV